TWVAAPLVCFAISNFCVAAFIVLGPSIFHAHFAGARDWGIVSACGSLGAIVGSLLALRLRPRHPLSVGLAATMLVGVPIAALAQPLPLGTIAVGWLAGMGATTLANTYWETTLQHRIPAAVFSRVRSYDILVSFVFMPVGFVTFPLLADAFGTGETLLAAG